MPAGCRVRENDKACAQDCSALEAVTRPIHVTKRDKSSVFRPEYASSVPKPAKVPVPRVM